MAKKGADFGLDSVLAFGSGIAADILVKVFSERGGVFDVFSNVGSFHPCG